MIRKDLSRGCLPPLAFFLILLSTPARVGADGCYVPERVYPKLPGIGSQTALIAYRDGVEWLVVQSSVKAAGRELAWLIPVPSTPLQFEEVSAGLLSTLSLVTHPVIVHDLWDTLFSTVLLSVLGASWFLLTLGLAPGFRGTLLGLPLLIAGVTVLWLSSLLFSRTDTSSREMSALGGVSVEREAVVGDHELSVLEAHDPKSLTEWLTARGFAVPPEDALRVIGDYIAQGWRFVAARVRRGSEAEGAASPNPLAISFKVAKPIYPLRLTAFAGTPLHLVLLVVADQQAKSDRLTSDSCGVFTGKLLQRQDLADRWTRTNHIVRRSMRVWQGNASRGLIDDRIPVFESEGVLGSRDATRVIAHPRAPEYLWSGCVVTRLSGDLQPAMMSTDLTLDLGPAQPHARQLYTYRGARETMLIMALRVWTAALFLVTLVAWQTPREIRGRSLLQRTAKLTAAVAFVGLVGYAVLPKVGARMMRGSLGSEYAYLDEVNTWIQGLRPLMVKEPKPVAALIKSRLAKPAAQGVVPPNPYTNGPALEGDSPGEFQILRTQHGSFYRLHQMNGIPIEWWLGPLAPQDRAAWSDVNTWIILLRSSRYRLEALSALSESGDSKAVKPIMELLGRTPGSDLAASVALTRLTGRNPIADDLSLPLQSRWEMWWEANKSRSRIDWLRHGLAQPNKSWNDWGAFVSMLELARLGDEVGQEKVKEYIRNHHAQGDIRRLAMALWCLCPAADPRSRQQIFELQFHGGLGGPLVHEVAQLGNVRLVKLVLDAGVSVGSRNRYGKTPLHIAVKRGHFEMAQFLLARGADANAVDRDGHSVMSEAYAHGLNTLALVELLREHDAKK